MFSVMESRFCLPVMVLLFQLVQLVCPVSARTNDRVVSTDRAIDSSYVLVIHGGAGGISREGMSIQQEKAYTEALRQALSVGYALVLKGESSLDVVEAVVRVLEDNELFNAGKGAVFNSEGKNELDASIMDGKTLRAGAVASVTTIRNPISAARVIMERSPHVMLIGAGAEEYAEKEGVEIVNPDYFHTEARWEGLRRARQRDSARTLLDHDADGSKLDLAQQDSKFGTVGAVALDLQGNLAAGTSTGGMVNKRYGRVGDSPIIGAGTYADNETVAVSATGWGEFFIRSVAAYDVAARMAYKGLDVEAAVQQVLEKIARLGGNGGLIAIDKNGNISMGFNTRGMYRAAVKRDGTMEIYMFE